METGDYVTVESERAKLQIRALVTPRLRIGEVYGQKATVVGAFVASGYKGLMVSDITNDLSPAIMASDGLIPASKGFAVRITKADPNDLQKLDPYPLEYDPLFDEPIPDTPWAGSAGREELAMKPNPRNILKLSDKRYDAKEPRKNRRLDVVYSLFKRRDPLPAQTEMAFFTDTSICSGCKSCEIACKQWNMLKTTDIQWSGNSYDNTRDLSSENWRHVKFIERFSEVNETDRTAPPR